MLKKGKKKEERDGHLNERLEVVKVDHGALRLGCQAQEARRLTILSKILVSLRISPSWLARQAASGISLSFFLSWTR